MITSNTGFVESEDGFTDQSLILSTYLIGTAKCRSRRSQESKFIYCKQQFSAIEVSAILWTAVLDPPKPRAQNWADFKVVYIFRISEFFICFDSDLLQQHPLPVTNVAYYTLLRGSQKGRDSKTDRTLKKRRLLSHRPDLTCIIGSCIVIQWVWRFSLPRSLRSRYEGP